MKNKKNNTNKIYMLYDENGFFNGFYDDFDAVIYICEKDNCFYIEITPELRDIIMKNYNIMSKPIIDIEKLSQINLDILSDETYLIKQDVDINLNKIIKNMNTYIKNTCQQFIEAGISITLSSGIKKQFSFKIEDQINLREIVDRFSEGQKILYHSSGEMYEEYTYEDLKKIYISLLNNKTLNLIYCQVLCKWIQNNFTEEMYINKEVVNYGYSNEEILSEVNKYYELQKISE